MRWDGQTPRNRDLDETNKWFSGTGSPWWLAVLLGAGLILALWV